MDNDNKLIKKTKKIIKELKFNLDYRDLSIMNDEMGNSCIYNMLQNTAPFSVVRGGATEMRCIAEYIKRGCFSEKIRDEINVLSGVFPNDDKTLRRFCEYYIECIANADLISLWGVGAESIVVHKYCESSKYTKLHALEPYYFENPWSEALEGKKILIVHPFTETIKKQYERRDEIFPGKKILPQFERISFIKAVQSIAGQKTEFKDWFEALEYMKKQIDDTDFDVAIIGAGAYSLPLATYCKKIGKKAIQMSGSTQILFGIKGKRWDDHPIISKFYNDAWVRPSKNETPVQKKKVEGGSYW